MDFDPTINVAAFIALFGLLASILGALITLVYRVASFASELKASGKELRRVVETLEATVIEHERRLDDHGQIIHRMIGRNEAAQS